MPAWMRSPSRTGPGPGGEADVMSELRRPACRNARYGTDQSAAPHGPHEFFPHSQADAIPCPGWTAEEAGAVAMLDALDEALKPFAYDRLPDSTRLAVHPLMLHALTRVMVPDRKSTRLNSSHRCISYAVFCLK